MEQADEDHVPSLKPQQLASTGGESDSRFEEGSVASSAKILENDGDDENSADDVRKLLSPITSAATVVNYLAAGYILLPWAFARGGSLLSTIVLILVVLQTNVTSTYVMEACARADAMMTMDRQTFRTSRRVRRLGEELSDGAILIHEHKFELSVLTRMFLGDYVSHFFSLTTALDLYGITWVLCSIFASAFSDKVPIDNISLDASYKVYVLIFTVIVVPLSCTSVADQLWIQMIFLSARLFMVLMMIVTVSIAWVSDQPHFGQQIGALADEVPLGDWSNLIQVIMTSIFATAYQFSVPIMSGESRCKSSLQKVFGLASAFSLLSNLLLALLLAFFFGSSQFESSNLNWLDYHGGTANDEGIASGWAAAVSNYVVMFPAVDGIAVYSLIAVSLGEIMMGTVYGRGVHAAEKNWKIRTVFRLLGSIPQAVGALFVSDLGDIARFAGIFTILSYTVCPTLLALFSERQMRESRVPYSTHYASCCSSNILLRYCLLIASFSIIILVILDATSVAPTSPHSDSP